MGMSEAPTSDDEYPKEWGSWEQDERGGDPFRALPGEHGGRPPMPEEFVAAQEAKRAQRAAYMRDWRKKHPASRRAQLEAEVEALRRQLGEGSSIEAVEDDDPEEDDRDERVDPLNPPYRYAP
jgi:acyl-CoA reductase-like NAD-dependent aldehyde dehydrogenase